MLRHFSFVLPLAAGGLFMAGLASGNAHAAAGAMSAEEALSILSQARSLDARCGFLNGAAHDELSGYVAKAEVVTAGRLGTARVRKALERGSARARRSECDADARSLVEEALNAAREAVRATAANRPRKVAASRPAQRQPATAVLRARPARPADSVSVVRLRSPEREREPQVSVVIVPKRKIVNFGPEAVIRTKRTGSRDRSVVLARSSHGTDGHAERTRYVELTERYYRGLDCGTPRGRALLRLYEKVREAHFRLLRNLGPEATVRARNEARERARRKGCGTHLARR